MLGTESVNTILSTAKARRVVWFSLCDDLCVYVNGTPFFLCERRKSNTIPVAHCITDPGINVKKSCHSVTLAEQELPQSYVDSRNKQQNEVSVVTNDGVVRESLYLGVRWSNLEAQVTLELMNATEGAQEGKLGFLAVRASTPKEERDVRSVIQAEDLEPRSIRVIREELKPNELRSLKHTSVLGSISQHSGLSSSATTPTSAALRPVTLSDPLSLNEVHTAKNINKGPKPLSDSSRNKFRLSMASSAGSRQSINTSKDEEEQLPVAVVDAFRDPVCAVLDVKTRLTQSGRSAAILSVRRVPCTSIFGSQLLQSIDFIYKIMHETTSDRGVCYCFSLHSQESIYIALFGAIASQIDSSFAQREGRNHAGLPSSANLRLVSLDDDHDPRKQYSCISRLVDENPHLDIANGILAVHHLLVQSKLQATVFDAIAVHTTAAVRADLPLPQQREHARRATCLLERYILLLLFHAFVSGAQENRMALANSAQLPQFKEFLSSSSMLLPFLRSVSPFEGCPPEAAPFAMRTDEGLQGAARWKDQNYVGHTLV